MTHRITVSLTVTALALALAPTARATTAPFDGFSSSCPPPAYTCVSANPTVDDATRCHAEFDCRIVCSPSATCVETFTIARGEATIPSGMTVGFNASTDDSALGPTTYGGDSSCSAVGCDAYSTRLTLQNRELTERFDGPWCDVKETPSRCALDKVPKKTRWTEFTVTMKCKNKILPCGARLRADVDFLGVVEREPQMPPPPSPPSPPPSPPEPPSPPPPPGAFAPGGAGREAVRVGLELALAGVAAYAFAGGIYVYALRRGWVEGFAEPCWDHEGSGCEILWCWCVPAYWRHSEEECLAAYESRNRVARPGGDEEEATQTTAPLLGGESDDDDDELSSSSG